MDRVITKEGGTRLVLSQVLSNSLRSSFGSARPAPAVAADLTDGLPQVGGRLPPRLPGALSLQRLPGALKLPRKQLSIAYMAVVVKTNGIPFWGGCTTHFSRNFSGDWDVHWGYGLLTHDTNGRLY